MNLKNLQLTGKISLEFDFNSSLLLKYGPKTLSELAKVNQGGGEGGTCLLPTIEYCLALLSTDNEQVSDYL